MAKTSTIKVAGLTWGLYRAKISGQAKASTGFEACWEATKFSDMDGKTDILVGAGSQNPTRQLSIPKSNSSSAVCKK